VPPLAPTADLHRRLVATSIARTGLVYGTMVAAVVLAPGLLCGAIGAFLLWFYRAEARVAVGAVWRRGPWPRTGPHWPMALPVEKVDR